MVSRVETSSIRIPLPQPLNIAQVSHPKGQTIAKQNFRLSDGRLVKITLSFPSEIDRAKIESEMKRVAIRLEQAASETSSLDLSKIPRGSSDKRQITAADPTTRLNALTILSQQRQPVSARFENATTHQSATIEFYTQLDVEQVEHRFLKESPKFLESFFDALIQRYPEQTEELTKIKEEALDFAKTTYGEKYNQQSLSREEALKEWGTPAERKRQKAVSQHFNNAIYQALALVEQDPDVAALTHKQIIQQIAAERKREIQNDKQKIDIRLGFNVEADTPQGPLAMTVLAHTQQFGDEILTSLDKRDGTKPAPVNAHMEEVSFTTPDGQTTTSKKLRTGSFDYFEMDTDREVAHVRLDEDLVTLFTEEWKGISSEIRQKLIDHIRIRENPVHMKAMIEVLTRELEEMREKARTSHPRASIHGEVKHLEKQIEKYQLELRNVVRDQAIIAKNQESLERVLTGPESDQVGMELPDVVKAAFEVENSELREKRWGMISLQTPVNVLSAKGLNHLVAAAAKQKKLPPFVKSVLAQLTDADLSELDSIHREMQAYKKAAEKTGTPCLYFNIPTNVMGRESVRFNLGPYSFNFRLSTIFNVGLIDKARSKGVKHETQQNVEELYRLSSAAIELLHNKQSEFASGQTEFETLQKHITAIRSLREQIFEVKTGDGFERIMLRRPPRDSAQFETIGRITVLMELLNIKTTGHCRSGNNRTAAWMAKSNQILGALAASPTGVVPPPEDTAARLDPQRKKDHWTLRIFEKTFEASLLLQKSNKGPEGTKERVGEMTNKGLRGAIMHGAISLANRFDPNKFERAKKR